MKPPLLALFTRYIILSIKKVLILFVFGIHTTIILFKIIKYTKYSIQKGVRKIKSIRIYPFFSTHSIHFQIVDTYGSLAY